MKNLKFYLGIICLSMLFVNCTKENVDPEDTQKENTNETIDSAPALIGEWMLNELVNISDGEKYLNTVLEFKDDSTFTNWDDSGTWNLIGADSIQLTPGIFDTEMMVYYMEINSNDSLTLKYHYTLDNKDAMLEYHYLRIVTIP